MKVADVLLRTTYYVPEYLPLLATFTEYLLLTTYLRTVALTTYDFNAGGRLRASALIAARHRHRPNSYPYPQP